MSTQLTTGNAKSFKDLLLQPSYQAALTAALPKHLTAERLSRIVLTAMNRSPKLMNCTKESVWECVMTCASLGLEPDALGRAYLIPYGDKCTFVCGYKGLAELAYRSGQVEAIKSQVAHANDHFQFRYGMLEVLEHIPATGDRGAPTYAYAYCKMKSGAFVFDVMSVDEVNRIRDNSSGYISAKKYKKGDFIDSPWETDWEEMAKKTVFRRLAKMLPLSPEFRDAVSKEDEGIETLKNAEVIQSLSDDIKPIESAQVQQ